MTSPFPPFSDLTSMYLSPLFASGGLRSSAGDAPPSNPHTTSLTNALRRRTPDPPTPLHPPSQPLTSARHNISPATPATVRRRPATSYCDHDEPPPPTATELEHIRWKRRQNTLAARKSRRRKQEHLEHLESTVERLTAELQTWRVRALTYQALLKNHGIQVPDFA